MTGSVFVEMGSFDSIEPGGISSTQVPVAARRVGAVGQEAFFNQPESPSPFSPSTKAGTPITEGRNSEERDSLSKEKEGSNLKRLEGYKTP